jgi:hypothetical protein
MTSGNATTVARGLALARQATERRELLSPPRLASSAW